MDDLKRARAHWLPWLVIAAGCALRIALFGAWPPGAAYDDHFAPIQIILHEGRLPVATDCWECYQPPLYYVLASGVYVAAERAVRSAATESETIESIRGEMSLATMAGQRAVQALSLLAGCATLFACLGVLRCFRRICPQCGVATASSGESSRAPTAGCDASGAALSPRIEALCVGVVAFLPQHLYMSAMATNDALTYLIVTLAVYVSLRALETGLPTRRCALAGALAGAAVLSKAYGMVVAAAVCASFLVWSWRARGGAWTALRPLLVVGFATAAIGVWPAYRNLATFGRPIVDNFDFFDTPMRFQPPGSVGQTNFVSLRFGDLLRRPWLHVSHANSFATELYGRFWWDYEGFRTSLARYGPWRQRWNMAQRRYPAWNEARWRLLLDYTDADVPPRFALIARVSYVAALPLTAATIGGLLVLVARSLRHPAVLLVTLNGVLSLLIPLVQTIRLPHFSAMKAAFALGGVSTVPIAVAIVVGTIAFRPLRRAAFGLLAVALLAIAVCDGLYVWTTYRPGT